MVSRRLTRRSLAIAKANAQTGAEAAMAPARRKARANARRLTGAKATP